MAEIWNGISGAVNSVFKNLPSLLPRKTEVEKVIIQQVQMIGLPPSTRIFIRFAGISGAIAVALGAYGSHVFRHKDVDPKLKDTFEIANKYHFIHTLALLAVPFARKPVLSGALMTTGIVLFCGSCYYHAITSNMAIRKVTPYGGFLLIFAWASLAL